MSLEESADQRENNWFHVFYFSFPHVVSKRFSILSIGSGLASFPSYLCLVVRQTAEFKQVQRANMRNKGQLLPLYPSNDQETLCMKSWSVLTGKLLVLSRYDDGSPDWDKDMTKKNSTNTWARYEADQKDCTQTVSIKRHVFIFQPSAVIMTMTSSSLLPSLDFFIFQRDDWLPTLLVSIFLLKWENFWCDLSCKGDPDRSLS